MAWRKSKEKREESNKEETKAGGNKRGVQITQRGGKVKGRCAQRGQLTGWGLQQAAGLFGHVGWLLRGWVTCPVLGGLLPHIWHALKVSLAHAWARPRGEDCTANVLQIWQNLPGYRAYFFHLWRCPWLHFWSVYSFSDSSYIYSSISASVDVTSGSI